MADCNRCDVKSCKQARIPGMSDVCTKFIPPASGWTLAELVLAHPTSLNAVLMDLPFEVKLTDYLKGVNR